MSFFRQNKERIIVTLVIIILISIIATTSSGRKSVTKLERFAGDLLSPVFKVVNKGTGQVVNKFKSVKEVFYLKDKNKELVKKVAELEDENRKYEDLISKSDFLRPHYDLLKTTKYNLIETNLVGREQGNWFNGITIDKGSKHGIKKGDIIVQAVELEQGVVIEGLVGRVVELGDNWAKVKTIVDELSSISFRIIRTQDGGIITGNLETELSGYLFDDKADVVKGDKLYTSGLGGKFIKDLYIGEVKEVINENEDMVKTIKVNPAVDFKKIYTLYVLAK